MPPGSLTTIRVALSTERTFPALESDAKTRMECEGPRQMDSRPWASGSANRTEVPRAFRAACLV
jgi:hypothetical protein